MANETVNAEPLLIKVMEHGKLLSSLPSLDEIRTAAKESLSALPARYKKLTNAAEYPVEQSQALNGLVKKLKRKLTKTEIQDPVLR